jgi:hypothetical protein
MRARFSINKNSGRFGKLLHELAVVLAFFSFTSLLTWPYINYLRDVVADAGDPYLVSWILWWDYHQTFTNPLHLFDANIFYPLRYTLAFSEHCYGLALPFFPLFAIGLRPLTVHAIALFLGFVFCGYGAFRLGRTLTGSSSVGWLAGIIFAFVPFRFHLLSHLPYLFSPWIPLVFEALVLFVRERSRKRTVWLGVAFFMNGLTSVSWFSLTLVPFAFAVALWLTRYQLWRDRQLWRRGATALGIAALALVPFMLPYYLVSKLYGFKRSIDEVKANSALPIHWLSVENRNKLWNRMGEGISGGERFKLFPGLLPVLFSLAAVILSGPTEQRAASSDRSVNARWLVRLDAVIAVAFALSIPAIGFAGTDAFRNFFHYVSSERVLAVMTVAIIARLCIAYPVFLHAANANLIETLRSERRSDAFWLGVILTVIGFCYSLGWNFFFYRICYDLLPMFRSMRVPTRGAMFAYLGLSILAGLGVQRLAELVMARRPRLRSAAVFTVAGALLLCELNAAPLRVMRGDVFPDAVSLRLKETSMKGGLVVLPAGADFNHRYILRAADHQRPLIVGTSAFNSPYEDQIDWATRAGAIHEQFLDLLEKIPTSYVVIKNDLIAPERRVDYESFLAAAIAVGRLRFINRFDGRDDLYAVVKTEPQAGSEAPLPFKPEVKEWDALIKEDPVNMLGQHRSSSQALYRFYVASYGQVPRYAEFLADIETIGQHITIGFRDDQAKVESNLQKFAAGWVERPAFRALYKNLSSEGYVDRLIGNAGISLQPAERQTIIDKLNKGETTPAGVLLDIVNNPEFIAREEARSLVLLHYFGYLRRNPDDPPDNNLDGFNYWLKEVQVSGDKGRLTKAFMASGENRAGK